MVARNISTQQNEYTKLLHGQDDDCRSDFITLDESKPVTIHESTHSHQYQTTYYVENAFTTSDSYQNNSDCSVNFVTMEIPQVDSTLNPTRRKRQASFHDCSDPGEDTDDTKSVKTTDENKKQNHSEIEKRRRDKMNTYITELSAMVPMCHAMSRKLDKLTVLRMAVQHLKTIRGAVHSYTEGHYKPSFLSDQELKHLILQAADGFLFVVGCDRGKILYVSESVAKVLKFSQVDLLGQSLFDILHPKDVAKVKEQLSASDLNPRERFIDAKTMLPLKTDVPHGVTRLCPGARRSFFCRMKCKQVTQIKEEADTTSECQRKKKQQNSDKKYIVIQCTGYLKSWAPAKVGLEEQESDVDGEACNLSCLVAIGKILPHISTIMATNQNTPNVKPIQFISRHALDGKFLFVDQRATLILGFLPQELLGTSMYEYYNHDDIHTVAECHKCILQTSDRVISKPYRFRTKDGSFIRLQSELKAFRNPWTKETEYIIFKNNLSSSEYGVLGQSISQSERYQENLNYFSQSDGKDIHKMINTHVEVSKIGRQIAEEALDSQRRGGSLSSESSPDPTECSAQISSGDSLISVGAPPQRRASLSIVQDHRQPETMDDTKNNTSLCISSSDPGASTEDGIGEIMENAVTESSNNVPSNDGNDEAAMAVIMSLLEADAGLGGPVDFSGLPWPLP